MKGDTAEWRLRMLDEHGLTPDAIEAWFRTGYTPAGIEDWYMQNKVQVGPMKEVDRRHFSRNDDTLLLDVGSTLALEIYNVMASDDVAVVDVNVVLDGKTFMIQGSSKRCPGDAPDRELGTTLAVLRALQTLTRRIERQAQGRIKNNEWIAARRPVVAEERRLRSRMRAETAAEPVDESKASPRFYILERVTDDEGAFKEVLETLEHIGLNVQPTNAPD